MQKLIDVFEIAVDRGKTDIGHLIDLGQALEHHVAQLMGRNGRKRTRTKLNLDIVDNLIELLGVNIALDCSAHQTNEQLVSVESLFCSIRLDDLDGILATLKCRKAIIARAAFTTALNGVIRFLHTGINNAGMCLAAFRTAHGTSSKSLTRVPCTEQNLTNGQEL